MPGLDWDAFASLPGAAEANFELLCRGVIRQRYGMFGAFHARANQPGVEFHLQLKQDCDALGYSGRRWGWQCKWYDLQKARSLGTARKREIEDGIRKTETHVPGITDWVLWTRRTLTKGDQEWFYEIPTNMELHLWTGDDVDNLLSGQAAVLRSTYFGELVLTPLVLSDWHNRAIAPIRRRWLPEVHHALEAERELRRMLGDSDSWDALSSTSEDLQADIQGAESAKGLLALAENRRLVDTVICAVREARSALDLAADRIRKGDLELLGDELSKRPPARAAEVTAAARRLRSANHPASLFVTNAVGAYRESIWLLDEVGRAFSTNLVGVLAKAGCGKTQLAAQLTAETSDRPNGVLLHGRDLHAEHSLDDLARRFSIAGQPVPTMDALLAAVDAAGQRSHYRLPVVVDGLNEAEDPRAWKPLLASLQGVLKTYPYVLFVCTLRPEFAAEALPTEVRSLEIPDYGSDTADAIRKHFRYFKIDATDAPVPLNILRHPLTLRLYCEVTNPDREHTVGQEAMPGSLTALFDKYLEQVADRIFELSPRSHRLYQQDVRAAIMRIGGALWDRRIRSLGASELRELIGDQGRAWDQSLVRALEQEGVLLRRPTSQRGYSANTPEAAHPSGDGFGTYEPVYDLLGGHIVADSLVARHGQAGLGSWLRLPETLSSLSGEPDEKHPLAGDVVSSMVGQVPRRLHSGQFWQLVEDPLKSRALRQAAKLEGAYLDSATVEQIILLARQESGPRNDILEDFWAARGAADHPLNAETLDRVLRHMSVADRDLRWSEWIRKNQDAIAKDLDRWIGDWREAKRRRGDQLRARWIMWTLTSTVKTLRDRATEALYWFGRTDPDGVLALTIDSLPVNDPYVCERMLAVAYGVAMAHQQADSEFGACLGDFLNGLAGAVVGNSPTAPSAHYLARTYIRGIVALAAKYFASKVPKTLHADWTFAAPRAIEPSPSGDPRAEAIDRTLHMDFRNYTLGRLIKDRANYDMDHERHKSAVSHVLGTVWSLGWRHPRFGELDKRIANDSFSGRTRRPPAERYGKKYGWIGFYNYAGILHEEGDLPYDNQRLSDVDIDPSFPESPPTDGEPTLPKMWLSPEVENDEEWIVEGKVSCPEQILVRERIGGHPGPWVAVRGNLTAADRQLGRETFGYLSALVCSQKDQTSLVNYLESSGSVPWAAREVPADYYTFAGEIPWSSHFAVGEWPDSDPNGIYRISISAGGGAIEVEVLAHRYSWESYHSERNQAGGALVPSRLFSERFDLRAIPQSFDQVMPGGTHASKTLGGVDGLEGDIVYLRQDLLLDYLGDRQLTWFSFGGQMLTPSSSWPDWYVDARRRGTDRWNSVRTLDKADQDD